MIQTNHILRSAIEVATERAAARVRETKAACWASRLDASAWQVRRFGLGWLAEHAPTGQVFQFSDERGGRVAVVSCSGKEYQITAAGCSCPVQGTCKHLVALDSVRREARRRELAVVTVPGRVAA